MTGTTYTAVTRHGTEHRRVDDNEFLNLPAAVRHAIAVTGTEPSLIAVVEGDELARLVDHDGEGVLHTTDELRAIAEQIGLAGVVDDPERDTRRGTPGHNAPRRGPGRRATISVTSDLLAMMLHLPEGVRVVHAAHDHEQDVVRLTVEGEEMPELDPGMTAWQAGTADVTVYRLDHDGHLWARAEWQFPWQAG